jgi:hypothetical protein
MMEQKRHYYVPNNLNKEPYLHIWWMQDYNPSAFFMQVSEDEQNPVWLKFGEILELIMRGELDSDGSIVDLISKALRFGDYDTAIAHLKECIK